MVSMLSDSLAIGEIVVGQWTQKRYVVLQTLGSGGFGTVYLVRDISSGECRALKVSRDTFSLAREFAVLRKVNQVTGGIAVAPKVDCLDDWQHTPGNYSFIVMEYVKGESLRKLLNHRRFTIQESYSLANLLGTLLHILHSNGYVYCDLKPENILYDEQTAVFRLIDFGGVRDMGSAVAQFTPAFDRASHRCGSRRADPGYDIFALTALMITLVLGKEPKPVGDKRDLPWELEALWKKVRQGSLPDIPYFLRECDYRLKTARESFGVRRIVYIAGVLSALIFSLTLVYIVL